ncbi:MAG: hypothetical protein RLZZ479_812 [Bacteroidota bacterium]|jgi:hypothetical protein
MKTNDFLQKMNFDQLYDYFYKEIELEWEKNGMRVPFKFELKNNDLNHYFENEFLINSEVDLEVTSFVLANFPYGNLTKYSLGDFYRSYFLIARAKIRYLEAEGYKSFKDFFENCDEAIFDKVKSLFPKDVVSIALSKTSIQEKIINSSSDLIRIYGYENPMNYLESEFNEILIELYIAHQKEKFDLIEFEESIKEKKSFLRLYQDSILKKTNISDLISLEEFIEQETSCSFY